MVGVEATMDAQPATEQGIPGVAGEVPGRRKRRRSAEAADEENATSSVVCGSELLTSESEHCGTIDDNTFPILCILEKDARGVYTVSGLCRLCDRTFRATGAVTNGKVLPWNKHARVHHQIEQHARKHGAVGYLPHRNLDEMRLDWARSSNEAAKVVTDASASTVRNEAAGVVADASASTVRRIKKNCSKCGIYKSSSFFRCTKSKERVGICGSCELLQCTACDAMLSRSKFATRDVRRYFDSDAKHLTCLVCKKQQQYAARLQERLQRQQRLQERNEQEPDRRQQRLQKRKQERLRRQQRLQERKEQEQLRRQRRLQRSREKYKRKARTCTKCGTYQGISSFRLGKQTGRVDICGDCELVPCAACTAMLSRKHFAVGDIRRYFNIAGAKHITCLVCKEQQRHARQQRLRELMKRLKRRVCTCKHPQAHTRTCLLRIGFA